MGEFARYRREAKENVDVEAVAVEESGAEDGGEGASAALEDNSLAPAVPLVEEGEDVGR